MAPKIISQILCMPSFNLLPDIITASKKTKAESKGLSSRKVTIAQIEKDKAACPEGTPPLKGLPFWENVFARITKRNYSRKKYSACKSIFNNLQHWVIVRMYKINNFFQIRVNHFGKQN